MKDNILELQKCHFVFILLMVWIIFITIPSVNAEITTLGTFKIDSCINLKQICANCTFVNISSVIAPNSTILLQNKIMTKQNSDYNYTFCQTDDFGQYIVSGVGNPNGNNEIWNYNFYINGIGYEITQPQSFLYLILIIGIFLILIFTLWGAIAIPWKNPRSDDGYLVGINDLKYLKVVLWIFVYFEVMFLIFILRNLSGGYLATEGTYSFFNIVYILLLVLSLPLFPTLIFFTVVIWISDKKLMKAIQRGIPV